MVFDLFRCPHSVQCEALVENQTVGNQLHLEQLSDPASDLWLRKYTGKKMSAE